MKEDKSMVDMNARDRVVNVQNSNRDSMITLLMPTRKNSTSLPFVATCQSETNKAVRRLLGGENKSWYTTRVNENVNRGVQILVIMYRVRRLPNPAEDNCCRPGTIFILT